MSFQHALTSSLYFAAPALDHLPNSAFRKPPVDVYDCLPETIFYCNRVVSESEIEKVMARHCPDLGAVLFSPLEPAR